ncbi:MAG: hypothetical protein ABJB74_07740 [Gemmatimonas sp.]
MSDRMTVADALADGKRAFNGRRQIVQTICLVVFLLSCKLLSNPATSHNLRIALVALTGLLAIGAVVEWGFHEKQLEEFHREVSRDANGIAFRVSFYVLWFMFLLDLAFGLPVHKSLPWGLPPLRLEWRDAAIVPLATWSLAYILNLKWRNRR